MSAAVITWFMLLIISSLMLMGAFSSTISTSSTSNDHDDDSQGRGGGGDGGGGSRAAEATAAAQATALFVFGDSLVDNGNNNFLNSIAKSNYYPYGVDSKTGATGRFSNGNTFIDYLGTYVCPSNHLLI